MSDISPEKAKYLALLVLTAALALRLPNLYTVPQWDWDEGYNLNYGWHLSEGRLQWFSIKYTFIPHPPLYLLAMAPVVKAFGFSIPAARSLSIVFSVITLAIIYLAGSEISGRRHGLIAAFLYAIYPAAIFWGRTALGNDLLALFAVASFYCFLKHLKVGGRWWVLACASASAAALTEYLGLAVVLSLLAYFALRERRRLLSALVIMLAPLSFVFLFTFLLRGGLLVDELAYQLGRVGFLGAKLLAAAVVMLLLGALGLAYVRFRPTLSKALRMESGIVFGDEGCFQQVVLPACLLIMNMLASYSLFASSGDSVRFLGIDYFWAGLFGFLLSNALRTYILLFFMPIFLAVMFVGRLDHMIIPLYPLFCLGLASVLFEARRVMASLAGRLRFRMPPSVVVLMLSAPFAYTLCAGVWLFTLGNMPGEDVASGLDAVAYVNSVVKPGQLVLCTSQLSGLVRADTGLLTQSFAYDGRGVAYYRPNMSRESFVGNISLGSAAYVLAARESFREYERLGVGDLAGKVRKWDEVYGNRKYVVYRNPASGNLSRP